MTFPSDIRIARSVKARPITLVAEDLGLNPEDLIAYGRDKAKVHYRAIGRSRRPRGHLILVSAMTPTPAGEGKTTTSIGLAQGLAKLGKKAAVALREPSMGPLFGMKGGATGGGYSQVIPMEDINLHFTGDFHAITAAHNLLSAALDNAIHRRQIPQLDPRKITFPRVIDINDRALRRIVVGLGGDAMGVPRENHFDITAASELMAILCLSRDYDDLKQRVDRILLGLSFEDEPITARSLKASGAVAMILKDAIHPNLVQTLEGVPAFIHGGPFANIAHGSNSILATQMALAYADYVVTEAGFGFDLGAEKFFDITSRAGGFSPEATVLVVTVRALKMHGGVSLKRLDSSDPEAVLQGLPNMEKHIENINRFHVPVVVAINRFPKDSPEEIDVILQRCEQLGVPVAISNAFAEGGAGAAHLAQTVVDTLCHCDIPLAPIYENDWAPEKKIEVIAKEMYGAEQITYTADGKRDLKVVYKLGYDKLGVCMAKTPKSLSDNPNLLGRPEHFGVTIRSIEIAAGAGFIVPIAGDVMRMPGLPAHPAYELMNIDNEGVVTGLE